MKKILIVLAIVILAIVSLGFALYWYSNKLDEPSTATVIINETNFIVEIADSSDEQEIGLSNREFIYDRTGMLFIFPIKNYSAMWMKDTSFPLDIIWIENDTIVDIIKDVQPQPNVPDEELRSYRSEYATNKVLELNAGEVDKYNIKVGDKIQILYN